LAQEHVCTSAAYSRFGKVMRVIEIVVTKENMAAKTGEEFKAEEK